jgi:hypothetical protein
MPKAVTNVMDSGDGDLASIFSSLPLHGMGAGSDFFSDQCTDATRASGTWEPGGPGEVTRCGEQHGKIGSARWFIVLLELFELQ